MNSNETNQPLISVIVPVYNIIPYLPRCVESLQKQTYPEPSSINRISSSG